MRPAYAGEDRDLDSPAPVDRARPARLADRVALAAVVLFALVGIGSPLLGVTVLANTDLLVAKHPYAAAGLSTGHVENRIANDIVASGLPNTALFGEELKAGRLTAWNPYVGGGSALGAVPNWAVLSPLTLPWYVLPSAVAPAYVKLLEIVVAVGGTYLFLRRLGLGRAAGWLGGLAFASSGFMISWTNWPQTRVAAFIPVVFWAAERVATQRRIRDGALLAAALAAMLFGGFPALTGYTVLTAGGYLLVRAVARGRAVGPILAGAGALVGAVALSAIQLVPFAAAMGHVKLSYRGQGGEDHLAPTGLLTSWAPWSLGDANHFALGGRDNVVESLAYVGAAGLVLFLLAVALPGPARAFLPRGVWTYLVAATAGWALLVYAGGPPLALLQKLPVLFADNFVGRARGVLGFLVAVLVAVGFEIVLRARGAGRPVVGRARHWAAAVGATGLVGLGLTVVAGWRVVAEPDSPASARGFVVQVALGLLVLGGTAVAVVVLLRPDLAGGRAGPRADDAGQRRRVLLSVAAVVVPMLVLAQALVTVHSYWPRVDRDSWFPRTDVHRFLAANLGHERFAASDDGMYAGADSAAKLRSLTGETFFEQRFAETVRGVPGELFATTLLRLPPTPDLVGSPVLDRLAVRYFVTAPWDQPFGAERVATGDGSSVLLRPGDRVTIPLGVRGPIRAVAVTTRAWVPAATRIEVSVRDARGTELARGSRGGLKIKGGIPAYVAVPGDHIPAGTPLTAVITVTGDPVLVAGADGRPALSTVAAAPDGLEVAYAGNSVVWRRTTALPRFRWASEVYVAGDAESRMSALRDATPRPDRVILDRPPALTPEGRPATITVTEDGTDDLAARVEAQGAGFLVVADALQHGWAATIDGEPADLLPADHGLVAIPVPPGTHTIRLEYRMPLHNAGAWISGTTLTLLLGIALGTLRRRRSPASPPRLDS
ncbi:YfhO family protein [Asanoa siamensis]|uniref:Membrane protein YfhO n=1 Tax=Asanoa siamensis TaxID=926357 RepID=A0ABQ4CJB2_9ACTN|nr:YfhO family protein [Asanoa siamensis]GIF71386.1 hypothetical protein Asi02nite_09040 [Asanoa siamensis]